MNKFLAILLLAVASSQLVLAAPIDDEEGFSAVAASAESDPETASLIGNERLFTDFCHEQRQYLIQDLKNTARQSSANLFKQFFTSANDFAETLVNVEKDAVEQIAQQIQSPSTPINDGPLPEDQVAALIESGKRAIAGQNDKSFGLVPGAQAVASALYNTVNSAIFINLAKARSFISGNTLLNTLKANCDRIAEYENTLSANLEATKSELTAANTEPAVQSFLQQVTINSLHCQSTKNVVRLNAFCELFKAGSAPFLKMLGIVSNQ